MGSLKLAITPLTRQKKFYLLGGTQTITLFCLGEEKKKNCFISDAKKASPNARIGITIQTVVFGVFETTEMTFTISIIYCINT